MLLAETSSGILPTRQEPFPMICPQCRSVDCFRSHRNPLDYLLTFFAVRPWRCHTCDKRFHAGKVAIVFARYVHCPKCGNLDLEHISADRVERGTLVALKRWLRFPAYRCSPCRQRFFSVLRFRRIQPATIPSEFRRLPDPANE